MRLWELFNDIPKRDSKELRENGGKIIKDVNTTVDVGPGEISKQAAKLGNIVTDLGLPPVWTKHNHKRTEQMGKPNPGDEQYGPDGSNLRRNFKR